ncbi:hypothetical protein [Clostridium sp. CMCC3677]|uniref:hypothetical protein n=1 Tax=Clostridium sp. CMCC3677 TaxID=2949963 RepID=UPI0013F11F5A|nr:hypothetical protein [Clostridium sp. CMCC3677]NFG62010.1 hypothetical protein [Clostridium botulinum]NFQ08322.1 hypothetical protein [Clostridium botulinum]
MDFSKYNSQVIKDIEHYVSRAKIGTILKSEQKEITKDNKKVNTFNLIIQLRKGEAIKIDGKNNIYNFTVSIDGKDVYKAEKCNYRDEEFRQSIKDAKESINFINCFEALGKIFKKKRK